MRRRAFQKELAEELATWSCWCCPAAALAGPLCTAQFCCALFPLRPHTLRSCRVSIRFRPAPLCHDHAGSVWVAHCLSCLDCICSLAACAIAIFGPGWLSELVLRRMPTNTNSSCDAGRLGAASHGRRGKVWGVGVHGCI